MIYEYKCSQCHNVIEVNHSMNESPDVFCEMCAGTCSKVIGNVTTVYNTNGFHNTDYKGK